MNTAEIFQYIEEKIKPHLPVDAILSVEDGRLKIKINRTQPLKPDENPMAEVR